MDVQTVNETQSRGIYQGASVMRLNDRGLPSLLIRNFPDTPSAVKLVEEIYAAGTRAKFGVYESYSYPIA